MRDGGRVVRSFAFDFGPSRGLRHPNDAAKFEPCMPCSPPASDELDAFVSVSFRRSARIAAPASGGIFITVWRGRNLKPMGQTSPPAIWFNEEADRAANERLAAVLAFPKTRFVKLKQERKRGMLIERPSARRIAARQSLRILPV